MADVNTGAAPAPAAIPANTPAPEATNLEVTDVNDGDFGADDVVDATVEAGAKDEKAAKEAKKDDKAASKKKKYQLKVDGKDEEVEFDSDNEEEVRKHLQLSKAAYKRMQESAEMKKGIQELIETLQRDPLKVISDPRLNIPEEIRKKMAESIINNELEEMSKTPEQKEKEKLQKEYERLKQEVESERKGREEAEKARLTEQQAIALDTEITGAIESAGLPKNARTVRYMAEALMFCLQNNLDLSAQDLVPYVKKQTLTEFKEMISSLPDEEFENWLGKDQITRLRKRSLARAKAPETAASIKPTGNDVPKEKAPDRVGYKDFLKSLGR